jgi:hypothetical protein
LADKATVVWTCPEKIKPICDAIEIADESERTETLLRLLPGALQSQDHDVRIGAAEVLQKATRDLGFDPLPLRAAVSECDRLEGGDGGATFLDDYELDHGPRDVQVRVYTKAIVEGEAHYGSVGVVNRAWAMVKGAREGLGELRSVIQDHHPEVAKDEIGSPDLSLDFLLATVDLRDGIEGTPVLRASRRLNAMPTQELWEKIGSNAGWRRAFDQTVREACKAPTSEACEVLRPAKARLSEIVRPLLRAETGRRVQAFGPQSQIALPGTREVQLRNLLTLLERNE